MGLPSESFGDLAGTATDGTPGDERDGGPTPLPTVSIVVASRNRRHLLRRFVSAVAEDAATTEVLVVLDGDVDGSYRRDRKAPNGSTRRFDPSRRMGSARWRRCKWAWRPALGDVVLLMDDDVIAGPGLVSAHARHHAGTHGLVVVGFMPVRLDEGSSSPSRLYATEYDEHCRRARIGRAGCSRRTVARQRVRPSCRGAARRGCPRSASACAGTPTWISACACVPLAHAASSTAGSGRRTCTRNRRPRSSPARTSGVRAPGFSRHSMPMRPPRSGRRPCLDGLSGPMRVVVSLLGRERWSGWSSKALMGVAALADRLRQHHASVRVAQLARRIEIACGYRCAARTHGGLRQRTEGERGPTEPGAGLRLVEHEVGELSARSSRPVRSPGTGGRA